MDQYKEHRHKLLSEEYKIHNEKINKLIGLIWYLSTGVYTVTGLALTTMATKPLSTLNCCFISGSAFFMILLYLHVTNRWNDVINILYVRLQVIEEILGFNGHLAIANNDKVKKVLVEDKKLKKFINSLGIRKPRIAFSILLMVILVIFIIFKSKTEKDEYSRVIIINDIMQDKIIEDSPQILGIKSSYKFILFFSKGSLLVDSVYRNNQQSINKIIGFLRNNSASSNYTATIVGYSSIERVNSGTHRVNNNYELSKARAENVKLFINELMLKNNKQLRKIEYYCGALSNQKSFSENQADERKVEITFYEISNIKFL